MRNVLRAIGYYLYCFVFAASIAEGKRREAEKEEREALAVQKEVRAEIARCEAENRRMIQDRAVLLGHGVRQMGARMLLDAVIADNTATILHLEERLDFARF